jgi:hypothetical protein
VIDRDRIASLDQVALVSRGRALDVRVYGGIDVRMHPDRGLDIGAAWFHGIPLAWISPVGEGGATADTWREAWGGGLVTTCGLDNVGAQSEGLGLHGTYTFLPAGEVGVVPSEQDVVCHATVNDPRGLRVQRTIRTSVGEGRIELVDHTANVAEETLPAPLLYHVNLGWPLWDDGAVVESDAGKIVPRDADAAPHDWRLAPRPAELPERVWEHVEATEAHVWNERLGLRVSVTSSLPRLWQWVDPTPRYYALALEPANCSVLGRAHDRAQGRLPMLAPGEERTTRLVVRATMTDVRPVGVTT